MTRLFLPACLLFLWPLLLGAQEVTVRGRVTDAADGKPLAFVNILVPGNHQGTVTDIEGNFSLTLPEKVCCLQISYVGYAPLTWHIDYGKELQQIRLHYRPLSINEVKVFPGVNPAHRIIRLAVANRSRNDPEHLKKFSYTSYDKMIITVDADSLLNCDTTQLDSASLRFRRFLEKQHLFIMETVTRHLYKKPDLNQRIVLASRMSGFKDPVIILMISQLQSPTFYREKIRILGNEYINPVSRGSTSKYVFLMEDTVIHAPGDTTYIISYQPKKNTRFNGMKGFLSINSRGWAIENVKAEPARDTSSILVSIQQAYQRIDTVWFPVQLKTDILFVSYFTASFNGRSYHPVAHGISYMRDINLDPDFSRKDFGLYETEIEPGALKRKPDYWNHYRQRPLTPVEQETYRVIDSVGKADNFDRIVHFTYNLAMGSIPIGPIDLELDKLAHYNDYEGFYLGAGFHTNRRFSKVLRVGGFGGYGFRDKTAKYGGDIEIRLHKASESVVRLDYAYQALPEGGTSFADTRSNVLNTENYGLFFTRRMNMTRQAGISYSFRLRPLRDFRWQAGFIHQKKQAYGDYMYAPFSATDTSQSYRFTLLTAEVRFAFREKVIETTRGPLSLGSQYPVVHFKYTRGMKDVLGSDFSFNRFDVRISDKVSTKYGGDLLWQAAGGWVNGRLPATDLFTADGTYRPFTLYAPNSFGTMRTSEFLSDRYAALFLTWDFRDLLFHIKKWKPRLMLLTNLTYGTLSRPQDHLNFPFRTLEKGYYESGFVIRQLLPLGLTDLGFGILYRYGPYSMPETKENVAYKFSVYYSF